MVGVWPPPIRRLSGKLEFLTCFDSGKGSLEVAPASVGPFHAGSQHLLLPRKSRSSPARFFSSVRHRHLPIQCFTVLLRLYSVYAQDGLALSISGLSIQSAGIAHIFASLNDLALVCAVTCDLYTLTWTTSFLPTAIPAFFLE